MPDLVLGHRRRTVADAGPHLLPTQRVEQPAGLGIHVPAVAAMLARCAGNANFFLATTAIYQAQPTWLAAADPNSGIESVMLSFGMSQGIVNSCVQSAALANGLGQVHNNALQASYQLPDGTARATAPTILSLPAVVVDVNGQNILLDGQNNDGAANPAFAPTLANVQQILAANGVTSRR